MAWLAFIYDLDDNVRSLQINLRWAFSGFFLSRFWKFDTFLWDLSFEFLFFSCFITLSFFTFFTRLGFSLWAIFALDLASASALNLASGFHLTWLYFLRGWMTYISSLFFIIYRLFWDAGLEGTSGIDLFFYHHWSIFFGFLIDDIWLFFYFYIWEWEWPWTF